MSNFNRISWIYDFLVRLVFGNALIKAQTQYIKRIYDNANILVIGGGTGKILPYLRNQCPNGTIDYVEASSSMIRIARKKLTDTVAINFIHESDTSKLKSNQYDYVISGFFLDVFTEYQLKPVINNLKNCLKSNGKLLVTDFHTDMYDWWWSRTLLKTMFLFFRVSVKLESRKLLHFADYLKEQGLTIKAQGRHCHSLVWTSVWSTNK